MRLSRAFCLLFFFCRTCRAAGAVSASDALPIQPAGMPAPQLLHLERSLLQKQQERDKNALTSEAYQTFIAGFREELSSVMARLTSTPANKGLHAQILARLGEADRRHALANLEQALESEPDNPSLLVSKGGILYESGDYPGSTALARQAWEASGYKDERARNLLKMAEGRVGPGGKSASIPALKPAADFIVSDWTIAMNDGVNPRAMSLIRQTVAARAKGDMAATWDYAQAAMNADPTSTAVQEFYKAVQSEKIQQSETKAYIAKAVAANQDGRGEDAIRWAQRAYDRSPGDDTYMILQDVRQRASTHAAKKSSVQKAQEGSFAEVISMTRDWITGSGEIHRTFGPGTAQVEDLKLAPMVVEARRVFYEKNRGRMPSDYRPLANYKGTFGLTGLLRAGFNPTQQFVGSFRIDIIPQDERDIFIVIQNTTSMKSFLYGAGPSWPRESLHPFGNMSQTYRWSEPMK